MTDTSLAGLRAAIERAGYYPELVADAVDAAVAGEDVEAFVVHQETTFDSEEVRRHITVLVLTTGRLVLGHADDHPADEVTPAPFVTAVDRGRAAVVGPLGRGQPGRHRPDALPRRRAARRRSPSRSAGAR